VTLKTGYQPRTNTVKDEKGYLVTDSAPYFGQVEEPFLSSIQCTLGLVILGRQKHIWHNHKCLWGRDGYWKTEKTQFTRYWSNPSRID